MALTEWRQRQFQLASGRLPRMEANGPAGRRRIPRAYRSGLLIIAVLTLGLLGWLAYRLVWQPAWLQALPSLLEELMVLLEAASAFTISFLWAGLALRHWRAGERPAPAGERGLVTRSRLYALSPHQFERYVADIFSRKGYQVELRGGSGDHGVDLELHDRRTGSRHCAASATRTRSVKSLCASFMARCFTSWPTMPFSSLQQTYQTLPASGRRANQSP